MRLLSPSNSCGRHPHNVCLKKIGNNDAGPFSILMPDHSFSDLMFLSRVVVVASHFVLRIFFFFSPPSSHTRTLPCVWEIVRKPMCGFSFTVPLKSPFAVSVLVYSAWVQAQVWKKASWKCYFFFFSSSSSPPKETASSIGNGPCLRRKVAPNRVNIASKCFPRL